LAKATAASRPWSHDDALYNPEWPKVIPVTHWRFFEQLCAYVETQSHIFIHACLDAESDMADRLIGCCTGSLWIASASQSGKRIICGIHHSDPPNTGDLGFALCLYTGVVKRRMADMFGRHQWPMVASKRESPKQGKVL